MDWSIANRLGEPAAGAAQNPRLVSAAHQFEASMMSELMKPLQENSLFSDKEEGSSLASDGGSGNALTGFASEALGRALSEHGGLGIARQILAKLEATPGGQGAPGPAGARVHTPAHRR